MAGLLRGRSYAPRARAERLVAAGRVVLAAFSFLAVWLDPAEPMKAAGVAYTLLGGYVAYAGVLASWVLRFGHPSGRFGLLDHAFDLLFFSLFMYFTSGLASPFFAYFVFSLVGATLRWQWRGTLWTAVVTVGVYLSVGAFFAVVLGDPAFELDRFIIRSVYLVVVAVLLGYLGLHEAQTRQEIALLAQVPAGFDHDPRRVVGEVLPWAGRVLGAEHLVLLWADREEPGVRIARCAGPVLTAFGLDPNDQLENWDPPGLGARDSAADTSAGGRVVHHRGQLTRQSLPALGTERLAALDARAVLSLAITGEAIAGRLLVLDPRGPAADSLPLGEVVGSAVAARLDHLHLTRRLRESAAVSERIRLARDLHDGVLQSLTGIALRLATLGRLLEENLDAARRQLGELQQLIGLEQRELRFLVDELKPSSSGHLGAGEATERARLGELAAAIERVWDVDVTLVDNALDKAPDGLVRHVHLLVREALVNAARHGGPQRIDVSVEIHDESLVIAIDDDGRGFSFVGRRRGKQLREEGGGPRSLVERVDALGGEIEIESSPAGARVRIILPLRAEWLAA